MQADFYLTPTPTSAQPDPRVVPTGVEPTLAISWQTLAGSRRVLPAATPIGPRSDQPRTAADANGSDGENSAGADERAQQQGSQQDGSQQHQ